MKIYMASFTKRGKELGHMLADHQALKEWEIIYEHKPDSLQDFTKHGFEDGETLIFIGACGIAVRSIAPFLKDKYSDPAVLVLDEMGQYVIPLVSGHVGGANSMARALARLAGGRAVITTATDIQGLFAVDVFAKKNQLTITDRDKAKKISAGLLQGERLFLYSCVPVEGDCPEEVVLKMGCPDKEGDRTEKLSAFITPYIWKENQELLLVPKVFTIGIGCRKNTPFEKLKASVIQYLEGCGINPSALEAIASIDIKKDEPAIVKLSQYLHVPLHTYSAGELSGVPGQFSPSSFVKDVTGVDNVCERAALCGYTKGTLITHKTRMDGITAAVAGRDWRISF